MADLNTILNEVLASGQPTEPTPAVAPQGAASPVSRQSAYSALVGDMYGLGQNTATELDRDLQGMSPVELINKYGYAAGMEMVEARTNARRRLTTELSGYRNFSQTAADLVSGVGLGVVNSLGGIGALGLGIANRDAGVWAGQKLNSFNEFVQDTQSRALANKRSILQTKDFLAERDSTAKYEEDLARGRPSFNAGLARIGRDILSSVGNAMSDPTTFSDGTAQGIGSLLPIGPVSGVMRAATGKLAQKAIEKGFAKKSVEATAKKADDWSAAGLMGAMEAGGSYQEAVNEIMDADPAELMKTSTPFRAFIEQGMSVDEAKIALANRHGLTSAALTAPAAVVAGKFVDKFAKDPFGKRSVMDSVKNIGKETFEEGFQGAGGKLSQNISAKLNVDENQSLSEGVGSEIGRGAVYGMGTAGVVQAPNMAARTTGAGLKTAYSTVFKKKEEAPSGINEIAAGMNTVSEQAPVIRENIAAAIDRNTSIDDTAKEDLKKSLDIVMSTFSNNPERFEQFLESHPELDSPEIREAVATQTNMAGVLSTMAGVLLSEKSSTEQKLAASKYFDDLLTEMETLAQSPEISALVDNVPETQESKQYFNYLSSIVGSIMNSKEFNEVRDQLTAHYKEAAAPTEATAENTAEIVSRARHAPTTLSHKVVSDAIALAESNPGSVSPQALTHLQLTESLLKNIEALKSKYPESLISAVAENLVNKTSNKNLTKTRQGDTYDSLVQYKDLFADAINNNDVKQLRNAFRRLNNIRVSHNNKIDALNRSLESKKKENYDTINGEHRQFVTAKESVWLEPKSQASIDLAQQIQMEADLLTATLNDYVAKFGEKAGLKNRTPNTANKVNFDFGTNADVTSTPAAPPAPTAPVNTPNAAPVASPAPAPKVPPVQKDFTVKDQQKFEKDARKEWKYDNKNGKNFLNAEESIKVMEDMIASLEKGNDPHRNYKIESLKKLTKELVDKRDSAKESTRNLVDSAKTRRSQTDMFVEEWESESGKRHPAERADKTQKKKPEKKENKKPEPVEEIEDTQVEENPLEEEQEEAPKPSNVDPAAVKKMFASRFQNMLGGFKKGAQPFKNLFRPATGNMSRLSVLERGGIMQAIGEALSSVSDFQKFTGITDKTKAPTAEQLDKAKKYFRQSISVLRPRLNKRLNDWLDKQVPNSVKQATGKSSYTMREYFLDMAQMENDSPGMTDPMLWGKVNPKTGKLSGRAGSITALLEVVDGKVQFHPDVVDAAVLAASQWFLTSNGIGTKWATDASIASALGLAPDSSISESLRQAFGTGINHLDAIRSLSEHMQRYLGVETRNDAPINMADSVFSVLAAETFQIMQQKEGNLPGNYFEKMTVFVDDKGNVKKILRDDPKKPQLNPKAPEAGLTPFFRYIPRIEDSERGFSTVMDRIVLVEPESSIYFEDDELRVSDTQLRSRVPLTKKDKIAQDRMQKQVHKLNAPMVTVLEKLGLESWLKLMGKPINEDANVNTIASAMGKNLTVTSAYQQAMNVLAEMREKAKAAGKDVTEIGLRYKYEVASTGRQMMQGKYNPQSDKTMRNMILPMDAVIDLTDGESDVAYLWKMAAIQMIGKRVYAMDRTEVLEAFDEIYENEATQDLLIDLNELLESGEANVQQLTEKLAAYPKAIGESEFSAEILHVLLDMARYKKGTESKDGLKDFSTKLYLEADGVANGPAGALMMLSSNPVMLIENMRKVGFFIGERNRSMNEHRKQRDNVDLYADGGITAANVLQRGIKEYANNSHIPVVAHQLGYMQQLFNVVSLFMDPKDITLDTQDPSNPVIKISRGLMKNPMTVTVYGSGKKGIANKITTAIMDALYESISNGQISLEKHPGVVDALVSMMNTEVRYSKFTTTGIEVKSAPQRNVGRNSFSESKIKDLTISGKAFENLATHIEFFLVRSLHQGISSAVGAETLEASKAMITATQIQSLVVKAMYRKLYAELIASKPEGWDEAKHGITRDDEKMLMQRLQKIAPFIQSEHQNWLLGGNERARTDVNIASNLNGDMQVPGQISMPSDAGVQAAPYLVIGGGDANMVQNAYNDPNLPGSSFQVFDGVNMSVDQAFNGSRVVNKAMADAWLNNNLMRTVSNTFEALLNNIDIDGIYKLAKSDEDLATALRKLEDGDFGSIEYLLHNLKRKADELDKRNELIREWGYSSDQMAAAGNPVTQEGSADFGINDNIVDVVSQFSEALQDRIDKDIEEKKGQKSLQETLLGDSKIKTFNLSDRNFPGLLNVLRASPKHKEALRWLLRNQGNKGTALSNSTLVIGTREELAKLPGLDPKDVSGLLDKTVFGLWDPENRRLILASDANSESLVHELIHAATLDIMHRIVNGDLPAHLDRKSLENALQNLETLVIDLLSNPYDKSITTNPATVKAYENMLATVRGLLANVDPDMTLDEAFKLASAETRVNVINEVMAWSISNPNLQKNLEGRRPLKLLRAAWEFIKGVLGIGSAAVNSNNNWYRQLEFNTRIMVAAGSTPTAPPPRTRKKKKTLRHAVPFQGDTQRISDTYAKIVGNHLRNAHDIQSRVSRKTEAAMGVQMGVDTAMAAVKAGFLNNPDEYKAFIQVMASMATSAVIDPITTIEATKLYRHVVSNLKVEDLLGDGKTDNPGDMENAKKKFDFLMGTAFQATDTHGRSSLVPAFVALGMIDPAVRKMLDSMEMPDTRHKSDGSWDNKLETIANNAMRVVRERMAYGGKNPDNINDALAALAYVTENQLAKEDNLIDSSINYAHDLLDKGNDYVVEAIKSSAEKGSKAVKNLSDKIDNKYAKAPLQITKFILDGLTDIGATANAQTLLHIANKEGIPEIISSVIKDLVGRTEITGGIYDLIKIASNKVSKVRQFYKEHLPAVLQKAFKEKLTEQQKTTMYKMMGRADIASLVRGSNFSHALTMLSNPGQRKAEIARLENAIRTKEPGYEKKYLEKSKQLAEYINTNIAGVGLLVNAEAIAYLLTTDSRRTTLKDPSIVKDIDELVSLYVLEGLPQSEQNEMAWLVKEERAGVEQILGVLQSQRKAEEDLRSESHIRTDADVETNGNMARFNAIKGFLPSQQQSEGSLRIAADADAESLLRQGYQRVADYHGSSQFSGTTMGYYFSPMNNMATFGQGIIQTARTTSGGVDVTTGRAVGFITAGFVNHKATVDRLAKNMDREKATRENLIPVFNEHGEVVAFHRSVDPEQLKRLNLNTDITRMLGQHLGRQAEETLAKEVNKDAIQRAVEMYNNDTTHHDDYINVLDTRKITDPVLLDAIRLIPQDVKDLAQEHFGKGIFMIRKDMVPDLLGERSASIRDAWSGVSRWSPETLEQVRKGVEMVFGDKALLYAAKAEDTIRNTVKDMKSLIVVKSVIVPAINLASNILQMLVRGVPINQIMRGLKSKTLEIDYFVKSNMEKMELEVQLLAVQEDARAATRLRTQIRAIEDSHKRLSVWPLIEAGEFGSISDVDMHRDDVMLTQGKLQEYIENKLDKLPETGKFFARLGLVSKNSALFEGLRRATEYGDFLGKAIMYDHLTQNKKKTSAQALAVVTDEFVNYNRTTGRTRGFLENMGMAWFYNYKLRITRTAYAMIREDPLRLAIMMTMPIPGMELPVTENIFTKAAEGVLGYSLGPGMGLRAPSLNPWVNLAL